MQSLPPFPFLALSGSLRSTSLSLMSNPRGSRGQSQHGGGNLGKVCLRCSSLSLGTSANNSRELQLTYSLEGLGRGVGVWRATGLGASHHRTSQVTSVCGRWQGHAERPRRPAPSPEELGLSEAQSWGGGQPAVKAKSRGLGEASAADCSVQLSLHPERVGTPPQHPRERSRGPETCLLRLQTHPNSQNPHTVHGAAAPAKWEKGRGPPSRKHTTCRVPGDPHGLAPRAPGCTAWIHLPPSEASRTMPSPTQKPKTAGPGAERAQTPGQKPDGLKTAARIQRLKLHASDSQKPSSLRAY